MKLLFDANLSPRLVRTLHDIYPGSEHVRGLDLQRSSDLEVWAHAKDHGFVIVTKDSDFNHLSLLHGSPPKVVWIRIGNCRSARIEGVLREQRADILRFVERETDALLAIA